MTIGILLNSLVEEEGIRAGGTVHTLEVAERWLEKGHTVTVFGPPFIRAAVEARLPCIHYVAMPDPLSRRGRAARFIARAAASIVRRRELDGCDVLFASSPFVPDAAPLLFTRHPGSAAFIAHVLPLPWRRPGKVWWNALASINELLGLASAAKGADVFITCSHVVETQLRRRGVGKRCYVTTNGIGHVHGSRNGSRAGAVCVSRLHPVKGIDELLRAWQGVADSHMAKLHVVGGGDPAYVAELEALRHRLGLEHSVVFEGSVDDAKRDKLLANAELFVFPSHEEGWGIAVAEALATGLPCVTYDLDVFREVFPEGRRAAPIGDVQAFTRAVRSLLDDAAAREELGTRGRESTLTMTWERAAQIDLDALLEARSIRTARKQPQRRARNQ